jgi:hypothetical protein
MEVRSGTRAPRLPLALEVRDPRLSMSAAYRSVDEVLHTSRLRRISNRLALLYLTIVASLGDLR